MSAAAVGKLAARSDSGGVYMGAVGPNDFIYMPAGFLVREFTGDSDNFGVRIGIGLPKHQRGLEDLRKYDSWVLP
eukprot:7779272-Alexandrium_andersonii.AAC.1